MVQLAINKHGLAAQEAGTAIALYISGGPLAQHQARDGDDKDVACAQGKTREDSGSPINLQPQYSQKNANYLLL